MARGKLIVFEGAEGAGKTTQIRQLTDRLTAAHIPCIAMREPGGTPVGDAIREILLHPEQEITDATEALLFMASRAELATEWNAPTTTFTGVSRTRSVRSPTRSGSTPILSADQST